MKRFEVIVDYTSIIVNNEWLNRDDRICVIHMDYDGETKSLYLTLTQKQIDHLAFMYQHGSSFDNIKIQAIEYEKQNKAENVVLEEIE